MGEASPGRVDVKVNRIYMKPLERAVVMSGNRLGVGRMQVERHLAHGRLAAASGHCARITG